MISEQKTEIKGERRNFKGFTQLDSKEWHQDEDKLVYGPFFDTQPFEW